MTELPVRPDAFKYFPEIDGLRAIAVVAVILNHLAPTILPSGYLGVDVFFVISGYVITLSLLDRRDQPVWTTIGEFYARRIKRLVPALALAVLVGCAVIRLFDPAPVRSTITGAVSLFGLSNVFLYFQSIDYFGPGIQLNPFSHTWSLGVEEQFYLFYPLILLAGVRQGRTGLGFRAVSIGLLSTASLLAFAFTYGRDQPAAYFLLPFRAWELGVGCLVALTLRTAAHRLSAARGATFVLVALTCVFFASSPFPVAATILAVTCSALLLMSARPGTVAHSLLSHPAFVYVGRLSYSLYLWHWVVICVFVWTVGAHPWTPPIQLLVTTALGCVSFHLVEDPLRKWQWFRRRWLTITAGLAGLVVAAGIVGAGHWYDLPGFSGSNEFTNVARSPEPGYRGRYTGRAIDECDVSRIWSAEMTTMQRHLAHCTATNPGRPHFVFVGDSHSMDLFPLAELLFERKLATVTNIYQPGCRVPPVAGEGPECSRINEVLGSVPADRTSRLVLVVRNNYAPKGINPGRNFSPPLETFLDDMNARGFTVVYVAPAPKYYSVGPARLCSVQWFRPQGVLPPSCRSGFLEDRNEQLARVRHFVAYLRTLEKRQPGLLVFDPFEPLCGGSAQSCTPVREGRTIYRDESHLTELGSELLIDSFLRFATEGKLLNPSAAPVQR